MFFITHNQRVGGSSPSGPTLKAQLCKGLSFFVLNFLLRGKALPCPRIKPSFVLIQKKQKIKVAGKSAESLGNILKQMNSSYGLKQHLLFKGCFFRVS